MIILMSLNELVKKFPRELRELTLVRRFTTLTIADIINAPHLVISQVMISMMIRESS